MSDAKSPTHLDADGAVHMVDVGEKPITARRAVARASVRMRPDTVARLRAHDAPKGDVGASVRIAGIMAAKRTSELIPLCHALALTRVTVDVTWTDDGADITAAAETRDRTGVEMEAMTAASVAALTLYDMVKGMERGVRIERVELVEKSGGRSGHWRREEGVMFEVREGPLSIDEVVAAVMHAGAGGVDVFLGAVRDTNDGRAVVKLEYEAYATMAVKEMARIGDEVTRAFPGVRVAAQHRVGTLAVGDLAVVCAASAPHRGEAFAACRALIDAVKARVPIWKREWGPDGPYWINWVDARCTGDHAHDHR